MGLTEVVDLTDGLRWPDPKAGPWTLTFYWANEGGRAKLVGLDLHGFEGDWTDLAKAWNPQRSPAELTAVVLRSLPLGRLADDAYAAVFAKHRSHSASKDPAEDARAIAGEKRVGRPTIYGAEHLAKVAEVYRSAPDRRRPTQAVADHFNSSKSTAAKWVARARSMGVLEPTTKGRVGPRLPRSATDYMFVVK